jgi:hypothetical protein
MSRTIYVCPQCGGEWLKPHCPQCAEDEGALHAAQGSASCHDCARPYGHEHGFPDLIIPYWAWKQISPSGDDGGLLCPSCICKRLDAAGINCEGAFMSGPIISVSGPTMNTLRRVENIELAIEGRNNAWSGVRELISPNTKLTDAGESGVEQH